MHESSRRWCVTLTCRRKLSITYKVREHLRSGHFCKVQKNDCNSKSTLDALVDIVMQHTGLVEVRALDKLLKLEVAIVAPAKVTAPLKDLKRMNWYWYCDEPEVCDELQAR